MLAGKHAGTADSSVDWSLLRSELLDAVRAEAAKGRLEVWAGNPSSSAELSYRLLGKLGWHELQPGACMA